MISVFQHFSLGQKVKINAQLVEQEKLKRGG